MTSVVLLIKQCDLNMLAMSMDKSEPDEVFRAIYLQRCELLRKYREKYGKKSEYQLRYQLDEARKAYVEKYVREVFKKPDRPTDRGYENNLRLRRQRAFIPKTCA